MTSAIHFNNDQWIEMKEGLVFSGISINNFRVVSLHWYFSPYKTTSWILSNSQCGVLALTIYTLGPHT